MASVIIFLMISLILKACVKFKCSSVLAEWDIKCTNACNKTCVTTGWRNLTSVFQNYFKNYTCSAKSAETRTLLFFSLKCGYTLLLRLIILFKINFCLNTHKHCIQVTYIFVSLFNVWLILDLGWILLEYVMTNSNKATRSEVTTKMHQGNMY